MTEFVFTDAQAMHAEHPATFYAPSVAELNEVQAGWYVKAGFSLPDDHPEKAERPQAERMWICVTEVVRDDDSNATHFKGTLANEPFVLQGIIDFEDAVEIEVKNCMDTLPPQ